MDDEAIVYTSLTMTQEFVERVDPSAVVAVLTKMRDKAQDDASKAGRSVAGFGDFVVEFRARTAVSS